MNTYLHPVLKLRMTGSIPYAPYMPSFCRQEQLQYLTNEIQSLLRNSIVNYNIHNGPPLVPDQNQIIQFTPSHPSYYKVKGIPVHAMKVYVEVEI